MMTLPPRTARNFTNFCLAKWNRFVAESEALFAELPLPPSCAKGERDFWNVLQTASKHCIPSGHIKSYMPGLYRDAVPLVKRCDELRCLNPLDPDIPHLNAEIADLSNEAAKKKWKESVESCGPKTNSTRFWSLLRNLSGKGASQPLNQPIYLKNKPFTKAPSIAKCFNKKIYVGGGS
jgi:hypothetical protein